MPSTQYSASAHGSGSAVVVLVVILVVVVVIVIALVVASIRRGIPVKKIVLKNVAFSIFDLKKQWNSLHNIDN